MSELKQRLPSTKRTSLSTSSSEEDLTTTTTAATAATTGLDDDDRKQPPPPPQPSMGRRALAITGNLANLLPTGTLLAFQLLTPIFTNNGQCDPVTRALTGLLIAGLGLSCFMASFTDSLRGPDGLVYYGLATPKGMWLFDYPGPARPTGLERYRVRFIDWVHAVLSVLVFGVVASKDRNLVNCFDPRPSHEAQEVLDILPVGVGVICSLLFVAFPTKRHGIGYPVSSDK